MLTILWLALAADADADTDADTHRAPSALVTEARAQLASATAADCPAVLDTARRLDMAQRTATDALLESVHPSRRPEPWLTAGASFDPSQLRSGDVLLSRGDRLSSEGIARIGVHPGHFSHNALVYVDDDGQAWTIEAYLERGAVVQPLEAFLADGVHRVAVLRPRDADTGEEAARWAYQRIRRGPPIPYDEALDAADPTELYCSQIAGWAYAQAGGPRDLPLHPTPLDHDARGPMFAAMGVSVPTFSAPADLLFDPRFQLVAEWRDVEALERMRRQDAVVEAVFTWMDDEGYRLTPRLGQVATVDLGLALRRTPGLGALLDHRLHPRGERGFLITALTLQQAGEVLFDALEADLGEARTTPAELRQRVEALRQADRLAWADRPRRAKLHRLYAPASRHGEVD